MRPPGWHPLSTTHGGPIYARVRRAYGSRDLDGRVIRSSTAADAGQTIRRGHARSKPKALLYREHTRPSVVDGYRPAYGPDRLRSVRSLSSNRRGPMLAAYVKPAITPQVSAERAVLLATGR